MRGWGMCLGGEGEGQRVKECRIRVREFFLYSTMGKARVMQIKKIRIIVSSKF